VKAARLDGGEFSFKAYETVGEALQNCEFNTAKAAVPEKLNGICL
jgi:hypothetical protein